MKGGTVHDTEVVILQKQDFILFAYFYCLVGVTVTNINIFSILSITTHT